MKQLILALTALTLIACQGPRGHQGGTGLNGLPGMDGQNGQDGQDGAVGPQGPQGNAGTNATPVTMVKLCNGTSTYPTVFVEYGICLQGKLYGVYSANGGFLALLPNGTYTSNAIGSSCNLTVNGCTVSH